MATAKAGLVLVNVNPAYKSSELSYCINKVGIKTLISARSFKTTDYYKLLCELCDPNSLPISEQIPSLKHFVIMKSDNEKITYLTLDLRKISTFKFTYTSTSEKIDGILEIGN